VIEIYTDGAAKGNPGPGGYGVVLKYGAHRKELAGGYRLTTNNRMELLAVIRGLEALKKTGQEVVVFSDSKYVVEAVEKGWLWQWQKTGFKKKKNADLWRRFIGLYRLQKVRFRWLKGHAGHAENERCDALATGSAESADLGIDEAYESGEME
jgi:ribonuclease HI